MVLARRFDFALGFALVFGIVGPDGELLGVLTMDNVGEYVTVQAALRETKAELVPP